MPECWCIDKSSTSNTMLCLDTAFGFFSALFFLVGPVRHSIIYSCFFNIFSLFFFFFYVRAGTYAKFPSVHVLSSGFILHEHLVLAVTHSHVFHPLLKKGYEFSVIISICSSHTLIRVSCSFRTTVARCHPLSHWPRLTGSHFLAVAMCQLQIFFCTSWFLCVFAVTRRSLHVHWGIKLCRYRQQDAGALPGVWQPLTLSPRWMTALLCQPLVFRVFHHAYRLWLRAS